MRITEKQAEWLAYLIMAGGMFIILFVIHLLTH